MRYVTNCLVFALFASVGCSSASSEATGDTGQASLGTPGGAYDQADHACNVVLRDIDVPENRGGLETTCDSSHCYLVFEGDLDVSAAAVKDGSRIYVHYQIGGDPTWYDVAAQTTTTGAGEGAQRYSFKIDQHTPLFDQPWPTIQVIPFLITTSNIRLWDHNASDGNTTLDDATRNYHADASVCPAPVPAGNATIHFAQGWTDSVEGTLAQNGKLAIDYDLNRMPQCFSATEDGLPAWNTEAYLRFSPGNQTAQGSVRGTRDPSTLVWSNALFTTDIPADATSVAIWFETSGDGCAVSWDSRYGQNYVYSIGN
ncbi:MAG TPA: DUF6209 family protein [Polyangiaceae bacterium]